MFAGTVDNLKQFMSELFLGGLFDSWDVVEAKAETFFELSVNGRLKKSFFDTEEAVPGEFIAWKDTKDFFYQMIKGKRLPGLLQVVLSPGEEVLAGAFRESGLRGKTEGRLMLNVRYTNGECRITGGVAYQSFTMDKSLEEAWDKALQSFLAENKIEFK